MYQLLVIYIQSGSVNSLGIQMLLYEKYNCVCICSLSLVVLFLITDCSEKDVGQVDYTRQLLSNAILHVPSGYNLQDDAVVRATVGCI